jgi:C4-dicarboxylate-specific signal transduction histidine kinase
VTAKLAVVSDCQAVSPPAQWSHDLRNVLAVVGLHLDTLARLSGSQGAKAANAAQALIGKASRMCSESAPAGVTSCRQVCDIAAVARDIVALLAPLGPEGFVITVDSATPVLVADDRNDLLRVLFNLLHDVLMVARSDPKLRRINTGFQREGGITVVRIADDGGGLPPDVAANLFRPFAESHAKSAADHGWGLPIARELAERNGGMLSYEPSRRGASFRLVLATATSAPAGESAVTRSLGRRRTG